MNNRSKAKQPTTAEAVSVDTTPAVTVPASTYKVLPWEKATDYKALRADMYRTYTPQGALECHLLDELAIAIWRKRRIYAAESAQITNEAAGLVDDTISGTRRNVHDMAVAANPELRGKIPARVDGAEILTAPTDTTEVGKARHQLQHWETMRTNLSMGRMKYREGVAALGEWRQYWSDGLRDHEYTNDIQGLVDFLDDYPMAEARADMVTAHTGEIREQVTATAVVRAARRASDLLKYEQHLDGKTRETLKMLVELQRIRMGG